MSPSSGNPLLEEDRDLIVEEIAAPVGSRIAWQSSHNPSRIVSASRVCGFDLMMEESIQANLQCRALDHLPQVSPTYGNHFSAARVLTGLVKNSSAMNPNMGGRRHEIENFSIFLFNVAVDLCLTGLLKTLALN
ncbi:hypothetical protein NE237_018827 [Protea cynaroides]|uniref:Uncharacterized protein n=1 Tax=Protea cynaroides TaxID=273540 RepID=A0A9Q0KAL5_9MAGN|nr:hypothetical protein NE237_018827 [Protea cynaroides]